MDATEIKKAFDEGDEYGTKEFVTEIVKNVVTPSDLCKFVVGTPDDHFVGIIDCRGYVHDSKLC